MPIDTQHDGAFSPHKKPLLSCAECRRLKLKCSRVWPCSSCDKRGLAHLCPSGALETRPRVKHSSLVPRHVVEHIHHLQARIRQLESCLASGETGSPTPLQVSSQSEHPMPYLQKKLVRNLEKARNGDLSSSTSSDGTSELEEINQSLGTLKISPDGRSVFFGPTAVTEGLSVDDELTFDQPISNPQRDQTLDIVALAETFPFASPSALVTALQDRAASHLPPLERGRILCVSYFNYASFVIDVVPQDEWFEALFQRIYGAPWTETESSPRADQHVTPQLHLVLNDELSLFFCVLALGALTDLAIEPFSSEAALYYSICRTLMTTEYVLTEPTICSTQTLALASYYEGLQSQQNSSRNCWSFMTLASKTAHIMGLHRDHSLIGLDDREMQKRRLIFWEVHSMDMIQSLATGRPICTPPHYMDTHMPIDRYVKMDVTGHLEESFYRWKYRFCSQVLPIISDHVLRTKTPNYAATLEADRHISQFSSTFKNSQAHNLTPHNAAQIQMMLGTQETCIMYIHRGFFAQAISIDPQRPEHGKYSRSVLRTFEGACIIIRGMHKFVSLHAKLAARLWFLWNHLLTAIFIVASISIRAPRCSLSETASRQLDIAEHILKQTASFGGRPKFMLPILQSLKQKAYNKRVEVATGYPPQQLIENLSDNTSEENDELAVIGGKTRVVLSKQSPSPRSQASSTSSDSFPPPSHLQSLDQQFTAALPDVLSSDASIQGNVAMDAQGHRDHEVVSDQASNVYSNYSSDYTTVNRYGYPVYGSYHYPYQSEAPHNPQVTHGSTGPYVGQAPALQGPVYSQEVTALHPSTVEGSSFLWHAMLQGLGIINDQ